MTISRDFIDSARAISTICCSATDRLRTSAIGLQLEADARVIARVSAAILRQLTKTPGPARAR